MTPDRWTDRLSDYLDGDLDAPDRRALDEHLATCADCANTLAQLRAVVAEAGLLENRPPETDLWRGIAARIGASGTDRPVAAESGARAHWTVTVPVPVLAAAGLALVLLSGGISLALQFNATRSTAPTDVALESGLVGFVGGVGPGADSAVAELERTLAAGRNRLDSTTVRVLQENLAIIDRAIAEARRALAADPASLYLNRHLAQILRRKVVLLRRASAIPGAPS